MLQRMGWREGEGLGRHRTGITAPLETHVQTGKGGLGMAAVSATCCRGAACGACGAAWCRGASFNKKRNRDKKEQKSGPINACPTPTHTSTRMHTHTHTASVSSREPDGSVEVLHSRSDGKDVYIHFPLSETLERDRVTQEWPKEAEGRKRACQPKEEHLRAELRAMKEQLDRKERESQRELAHAARPCTGMAAADEMQCLPGIHTSAYVGLCQHTSEAVAVPQLDGADERDNMNSDEEQHASACVSKRQHTPVYASILQLDGADEGDNMNSDEEGGGRVVDESASKESGRKGGRGEGSRSEGGGCSDESNEHDDTIGTIRMIVLVGIPGSGKSFVANMFKKEGWIVVCQDELGDRRKCEQAARKATPCRIELKHVRALANHRKRQL
jgi:hypothetical protein